MSIRRNVVTVIDDDAAVLRAIERLLVVKGLLVKTFASAEAFLPATQLTRRRDSFLTSTLAGCRALHYSAD